MKQLIILSMLVLITGCNSIAHKNFGTIQHMKGGKLVTAVDPSSYSFTPSVMAGELTNILLTVPYGTQMKIKVTTYSWWCFWRDMKSLEMEYEVDATGVDDDIIKESIKSVTK